MIRGFEDYTKDLTKDELDLLPKFVNGFNQRVGKKNAITNAEIRRRFMSVLEIKLSDTRIRKIVNHIRKYNLCSVLLASSKGYWVSRDKQEIQNWIDSMQSRIDAMSVVKNSVKKQLEFLDNHKLDIK